MGFTWQPKKKIRMKKVFCSKRNLMPSCTLQTLRKERDGSWMPPL
ncbi:hypothetical protein HMPREF3201_01608 [Megasphaera sp. MJR8396C]|nr:hypothetical protein HMPREF3201_01608 [Megasphaera sp. MJR8396C]